MKLKIYHKSTIPLHAQVEELLRKMIQESDYQQGMLFPNEVNIARQLGLSRNTMSQAIGKLVIKV